MPDRSKQLIRGSYTEPRSRKYTLLGTYEYVSCVVRAASLTDGTLENRCIPSIRFLYRGGPRPLELTPVWQPGPEDPPLNVADMTSVILNTRGMLMPFIAIPPQWRVGQCLADPTNWRPLFGREHPMDRFSQRLRRWAPKAAPTNALRGRPLTQSTRLAHYVDVELSRPADLLPSRRLWTVPTV